MADNTVPIPQGATIGGSGQQPESKATGTVPIPQDATIGASKDNNVQPSGHHFDLGSDGPGPNLKGLGNVVGQTLSGIGEGVFSTVAGAADLANKIPGVHIPTDTLHELAGDNETRTTAEKFGYGGETLLEFVLGDEALKGLTQAQKLDQAAKTMKILEKSPKTMAALRAGANALRMGATQAAQTTVRTGGDVKQGLEEGKHVAEVAGPLGLAGEGLSALGGRMQKGAEVAKTLSSRANNAASKTDVASEIQNELDLSKEALHNNYETTINNFKGRLKGGGLDPLDSNLPIAGEADKLLQKPVPGQHQLAVKAQAGIKEGLKPWVRDILESAKSGLQNPVDFDEVIDIPAKQGQAVPPGLIKSTGKAVPNATGKVQINRFLYTDGSKFSTKPFPGSDVVDMTGIDPSKINFANGTYSGQIPSDAIVPKNDEYTIDNLIGLRQTIRRAADTFDYGDTNSRTLRQFLHSIDDTIGRLADNFGDKTLPMEYKNLRADYASKINIFDTPLVKNLREGKYADAGKVLLSSAGGNQAPYKLDQLRTVLGDQVMDNLSKGVVNNILQDSTEKGQLNPSVLIQKWSRIPQETKDALFSSKGLQTSKQEVDKLMSDAKTASNIQHLTRVGVITPVVAAGGLYYHLGLISALLAESGAYGVAHLGGVRQLVDYVANHPNTWKMVGLAGKLMQPNGPVGTAVKAGIAKETLNDQKAKRGVFSGAQGLAGNQ